MKHKIIAYLRNLIKIYLYIKLKIAAIIDYSCTGIQFASFNVFAGNTIIVAHINENH